MNDLTVVEIIPNKKYMLVLGPQHSRASDEAMQTFQDGFDEWLKSDRLSHAIVGVSSVEFLTGRSEKEKS